jgi:hypothetical protein
MPTLTQTQTTTSTIIHVARGKVFVGEIILDAQDRVRHADRGIPRDVVLKTLVTYTRTDDVSGPLLGANGKSYRWQLIGWNTD